MDPEGIGKGKDGSPYMSRLLFPLRNKGCGYLEKFAQGCEASPVAERKPEALTKGLAESGLPAI